MNTQKNLIILFLLCCTIACNNDKEHFSNSSKFSNQESIEPSVCFIEEDLNIVDFIELENFYVVQNDVETENNQLFVYNKSNKKFLYSFAMRGHGHDETIAMDMIQNARGDTIEIIDQAKYKTFRYCVTPDKAILINSKIIKYNNSGPLQEVYRVNDSILIFNTLDGKICTYNDSTSRVVYEYDICKKMGLERTDRESYNFHFAYNDTKLCVGFRHINSLVIGEVTQDAQIKFNGFDNVLQKLKDIDKEVIYYAYVSMNNKNIMGQFMGYAPGFIQKVASNYKMFSPKFELEIYSPNLVPQKHIVLKSDVLRCKLSTNNNIVLSWNPLAPKENILHFKY